MPIRRDLRHHYRTPEWLWARERTLVRAGDRCESCGLRNGVKGFRRADGTFASMRTGYAKQRIAAGARPTTIQLGVAHLDHDPANNYPENLRALCRRCHLLYDAEHHRATRAARKDRERPILAALAEGNAISIRAGGEIEIVEAIR